MLAGADGATEVAELASAAGVLGAGVAGLAAAGLLAAGLAAGFAAARLAPARLALTLAPMRKRKALSLMKPAASAWL